MQRQKHVHTTDRILIESRSRRIARSAAFLATIATRMPAVLVTRENARAANDTSSWSFPIPPLISFLFFFLSLRFFSFFLSFLSVGGSVNSLQTEMKRVSTATRNKAPEINDDVSAPLIVLQMKFLVSTYENDLRLMLVNLTRSGVPKTPFSRSFPSNSNKFPFRFRDRIYDKSVGMFAGNFCEYIVRVLYKRF